MLHCELDDSLTRLSGADFSGGGLGVPVRWMANSGMGAVLLI